MIFIIEGPDGAGKTSLARMLQDQYGLVYHHEGPPPTDKHPILHYGKLLQDARLQHRDIIFDRLYLGERVYGPLLRGKDRLGADGEKLMKRLVSASGCMPVLCLPPYEVAKKNWSSGRPELIAKQEVFTQTYDSWCRTAATAGYYIFDYTKDPDYKFLLERVRNRQLARQLPSWIIGSPSAKFLLIGDRGSKAEDAEVDLPFWGVDNSSKFLNDALADVFSEDEMAMMNAYNAYDGLAELIPSNNAYGQPWRIITLGKNAAKSCKKTPSIQKFVEVPHPQFWRRFRRHADIGYSQLILNRLTHGHHSPLPR